MDDSERFKLLHGPYAAPIINRGDTIKCEHRGVTVVVGGMSSGRIGWPTIKKTGTVGLIVCGDLVRAVRLESEIAISHHWGVGVVTIWKWRKSLGVGQYTDGTNRLHRDYKPEKLPDEIAAIGRENALNPESLAKMAATKTGKPIHPNTRKALLCAAKIPWDDERRKRSSIAAKARNQPPSVDPNRPHWTPEEDAILGTASDREIAERLSRTIPAIRTRRKTLEVPPFGPSQPIPRKK